MGFTWSPGWTLLLAAAGLFFFIFAIWAIHTYFRGKKPDPIISEQPQASYRRSDPTLKHSLYSCAKLDITNPRDSTSSLILNDTRYSAPPPAYSRPPSFISSTIHPRESSLSLASLRQSIHEDDLSLFEGPRNSIATSVVPSRTPSPASSRRQSMHGSVYNDPGISLAALRVSIYGDSNPVFGSPRNSSSSLPLPRRPASLSPTRMTPRQSSTDLNALRGRQPSGSLEDLRHSLYAGDSHMCAHPENPGAPLFISRIRTASPSNDAAANRYSCPEFFPPDRSSSLSRTPIPAPAMNAILDNPPIRRPKTSIDHLASRLVSLEGEYVARPKTSNTERTPIASLAQSKHISEGVSEPTTPGQAEALPWVMPELEHIARPRTSSSRPVSLVQLPSELMKRPKSSIAPRFSPPTVFESHHAEPARVYTPTAALRRVSRPVEPQAPPEDEFVAWARSLQLLEAKPAAQAAPIVHEDFVYSSQGFLPGTAL